MMENPEMLRFRPSFLISSKRPGSDSVTGRGSGSEESNANKRLNGFYDEETQTFMDSTSMAAMSLNLKRNQVVEYIEGVKRQTFKALDEVKAFINGENLGPSQIEAVENILKGMSERFRS